MPGVCPMRLARRTGRRTRALPARRPLRTTRRGPRERPRAHAQPLQARFRPLRVPPPRQDGLHGGPPCPPPPCLETAVGFDMGGSRCGGSLRRPRTAGLRRRSQRAGSAWAEARRRQRDGQRPGRSGPGELQRRPWGRRPTSRRKGGGPQLWVRRVEQPHVHPRPQNSASQIAVTVGYCQALGSPVNSAISSVRFSACRSSH